MNLAALRRWRLSLFLFAPAFVCLSLGVMGATKDSARIADSPDNVRKMTDDTEGLGWRTILDLPVHRTEYTTALSGDLAMVDGEYVSWVFFNDGTGVDEKGRNVPIKKGDRLRVRGGELSRMAFDTPQGQRVNVVAPANVKSLSLCLKVAPIRLSEEIGEVSSAVIRNRIGSPSSLTPEPDGGRLYHYSSGIIAEGWFEYEVGVSHAPSAKFIRADGKDTTAQNVIVSTTNRPVYFERRFYAYDFTLKFDKDERLVAYQDLAVEKELVVRHEPLKDQTRAIPQVAPPEKEGIKLLPNKGL